MEYIQVALAHPDHTELLPFSGDGDAKVILDEIWNVRVELSSFYKSWNLKIKIKKNFLL